MKKIPTTLLVVAAALIDQQDRILVQQRSPGREMAGLWEFPGGKVEAGETPEAALVRELAEELGIEAQAERCEPIAFASAPNGDRHMLLLLYVCRKWAGEPRALDASALTWASLETLRKLPMPPADAPLVEALARLL